MKSTKLLGGYLEMYDIESKIITRIEYKMPQDIKTKYPDLNFTTSERNETITRFPNVLVHVVTGYEVGQTLENIDISGMNVSVEIKVTDLSEQNANEIMVECCKIMKSMRFSVSQYPILKNLNNSHSAIARFRRIVGSGDIY